MFLASVNTQQFFFSPKLMHFELILVLKISFIYLLQRQREGETERDTLHVLVHSPNDHGSHCWARSKSGAWNSIWVFHGGSRGPNTLKHLELLSQVH